MRSDMVIADSTEHKAVILTALPCEYKAVRSHLEDLTEVTHSQGTIYEQGKFNGENGSNWTVALAEIGPGNNSAATEAERAASFFRPRVMLLVGIAGGVKDVTFFDVVAATKVYGYESGKAKEQFEPRPEVGQSSYSLVQRSRAEAKKEAWIQRVKCRKPRSPNVYVGPIAAGEKVVASTRSQVYGFIRGAYGDALAVEMEGAGFLRAAYANPSMRSLIVRGISDLIDKKEETDTTGYQDTAAHIASAFAFEVLANSDLADAGESRREESENRSSRSAESTQREKWVIKIEARLDTLDDAELRAITTMLRKLSCDSKLTVEHLSSGSVKLHIDISPVGAERLRRLVKSGDLKTVSGFAVTAFEPDRAETFERAQRLPPSRVLFINSAPSFMTPLRLGEEYREIAGALMRNRKMATFEVVQSGNASAAEIAMEIRKYEPAVIHFSGHGSLEGGVYLQQHVDGRPLEVSGEALRAMISTARRPARLVILNACYTSRQAESIAEIADFVVGLESGASDLGATAFAAAFYDALAAGSSVGHSFLQANSALELNGLMRLGSPKLTSRRGVDPYHVTLAVP
jgi:nucleoside phosphorylase